MGTIQPELFYLPYRSSQKTVNVTIFPYNCLKSYSGKINIGSGRTSSYVKSIPVYNYKMDSGSQYKILDSNLKPVVTAWGSELYQGKKNA